MQGKILILGHKIDSLVIQSSCLVDLLLRLILNFSAPCFKYSSSRDLASSQERQWENSQLLFCKRRKITQIGAGNIFSACLSSSFSFLQPFQY